MRNFNLWFKPLWISFGRWKSFELNSESLHPRGIDNKTNTVRDYSTVSLYDQKHERQQTQTTPDDRFKKSGQRPITTKQHSKLLQDPDGYDITPAEGPALKHSAQQSLI